MILPKFANLIVSGPSQLSHRQLFLRVGGRVDRLDFELHRTLISHALFDFYKNGRN